MKCNKMIIQHLYSVHLYFFNAVFTTMFVFMQMILISMFEVSGSNDIQTRQCVMRNK